MLTFEQWTTANAYDLAELNKPENAKQRSHLEAAWKAETAPVARAVEMPASPTEYEANLAKAKANAARCEAIRGVATEAISRNSGNKSKIDRLEAICGAAVADEKCTIESFRLQMLQEDRTFGLIVSVPQQRDVSEEVIQAAVCSSNHLPNVEEQFSEQTLETADKYFKRGIGLREILQMAAERNSGYRGSSRDLPALFRAAFQGSGLRSNNHDMMSAGGWGPSTISVPNILSNVANKFLFVGFNAIDTAWQQIASTRAVNDYKQITTVGLTGDIQYSELPPGGEIKHGTLGETTYTNQATIYARMIGIDERDIRNDDTGAFSTAAQRLGRGAALKLNDRFWTVFLNNSAFFSAGNNNVITGGTSVLSGSTGLAALALADEKFRIQTDPDGKPLGVLPKLLVVPSSLRVHALNLMNSTTIVGSTTADSMRPDQNAFAGAFTVVSSPYMQNSSYTGFSTTAWYILASPDDMPVIQVVFLDGIQTPMVETAEADFNMLGVSMRGVIKFGVALQEFRGGVRGAGA